MERETATMDKVSEKCQHDVEAYAPCDPCGGRAMPYRTCIDCGTHEATCWHLTATGPRCAACTSKQIRLEQWAKLDGFERDMVTTVFPWAADLTGVDVMKFKAPDRLFALAMKAAAKQDKTLIKDCTRCGGCGHYSFNPKDGTVCFGCSGSGKQYAKYKTVKAKKQYLTAAAAWRAGHDAAEAVTANA